MPVNEFQLVEVSGTFVATKTVLGLSSGLTATIVSWDSTQDADMGTIVVDYGGDNGPFWMGETLYMEGGVTGVVVPGSSTFTADGTEGSDDPEIPEFSPITEGDPVSLVAEGLSPSESIAAIDQVLEEGIEIAAYTVEGASVQMRPLSELLAARRYFLGEAARAAGLRRTRARLAQ